MFRIVRLLIFIAGVGVYAITVNTYLYTAVVVVVVAYVNFFSNIHLDNLYGVARRLDYVLLLVLSTLVFVMSLPAVVPSKSAFAVTLWGAHTIMVALESKYPNWLNIFYQNREIYVQV